MSKLPKRSRHRNGRPQPLPLIDLIERCRWDDAPRAARWVGRYVSWRWWWVLPIAIIAGVLGGLLAGIGANAALMLLGYRTNSGDVVLSTIRNALVLGPILATASAFITRYMRRPPS